MAVRPETVTLESVARALELARQDVEAVLADNQDWQASRALREHSATGAERERLAARLALVPAYRSHMRITEALRQLSELVMAQSADRSNGWSGEIPASAASLHRANAEAERERQLAGDVHPPPPLSGWQAETAPREGPEGRMSVDLEQLVSRIRKGANRRGPLPLKGLLAEIAAAAPALRPPSPKDDEIVFPPRAVVRDEDDTAPAAQAIELTPVSPWNETRPRGDDEIVVEDRQVAALTSRPDSAAQPKPLDQLSAMEAEIDALEAGVARPLPPKPKGVIVPAGFDPASIDLGEAFVEIVRKPRDKWGEAIDVQVEDADDRDANDGSEARVEIVRRT